MSGTAASTGPSKEVRTSNPINGRKSRMRASTLSWSPWPIPPDASSKMLVRTCRIVSSMSSIVCAKRTAV